MFCQGRVLQFDNFRVLQGFDWPGFPRHMLWSQDKGHEVEMRAVVDGVRHKVGRRPSLWRSCARWQWSVCVWRLGWCTGERLARCPHSDRQFRSWRLAQTIGVEV